MRTVSRVIIICLSFVLFSFPVFAEEKATSKEEISSFLEQLFDARTKLLVNNDERTIDKYYISKEKVSTYAFKQEKKRANYIHAWGKARGVTFTEAAGTIRIGQIKLEKDTAKAYVIHTLKLTYTYPGSNHAPYSFGVGTRHSIKLKKVQGVWRVAREWYSDPIEENPKTIAVLTEQSMLPIDNTFINHKQPITVSGKGKRYNREKAVAYANKYAGAAWGAGNDHKYNQKYRDYNYTGGDCTNFASQVIGDPEEGGGLPMRGGWHYYYKQGGSKAWVQTDAFKNFLIWSGYGRVVARGNYQDLMQSTSKHPNGAIAKLQPGDLIGYELKRGDVDHFCIVVGRDDKGYVLVNSHSGDRYHVPWDMGWDKYTSYILIHMND